ncbi:hypothetical protein [Lactococcus lactis]|uniref:hypothetical protein n=1 Tax=Lactococcus lactis TaxID=1358 RepID=UPI0024A6ABE2|nr:hypothetical protein [Lactococcus lactis]
MKKFRLVSSSFMDQDGVIRSRQQFVEAKSFADVIEYIESNAGWYIDNNAGWYIDNNAGWHTANNAAFKVAYIEEVVE